MVYKKNVEYGWANNFVNIDAQIVGTILANIYEEYEKVTTELIIKEAHRKDSPLHGYFEWDDNKAAEAYRKEQARSLIRDIRIIKYHNNDKQDVKAFISVMTDEGKSYQAVATVLGNEELRNQIIKNAKKNISYWAKELKRFKEFAKIVMEIEQLVLNLDNFDLESAA